MVSLPIFIPSGAEIFVKEGDRVSSGQAIARKPAAEQRVIHLADILHVSPHRVQSHLLRYPGDSVNEGDVIAVKRSGLGLNKIKVQSNISGMITELNEETGDITIGQMGDTKEHVIVCPIAGTIQLCNNDQVVVQTNEHVIQGIGGAGSTIQAVLFVLSVAENPTLSTQELLLELNNSIVDRIILGRSFSRDALIKSIGIGCLGVIATEVDPIDLEYLQQRNMIIPIVLVQEDQLRKISQQNGKPVFLDGASSTLLLLG